MKRLGIILIGAALAGCATTAPPAQMSMERTVWMRTDGRSAAGNPEMTKAFEDAKAFCALNATAGAGGNGGDTAVSRACMADRGYVLVPESQVEARAAAARANAAAPVR